jgi:serine/threonine protein kinase/formylglycine-generating enzyme required for sulfatase activity/cephalosporin-C deacetylase-like acetyl esterase
MYSQPISVKAIFDRALEMESAVERQAYLDEACAEAPQFRQKVEALLKAYEAAGSYLESPAVALAATVDHPISERPGTVIGPYKLMEQIGEGGMGLVFVAEQQQPVRRKVALKVIKPGMDTRQVIGRFEAERQALALMDHPNIAKVLDGGETASGRPYFVMELVKGMPITEYCDQNQVPIRDRLELFFSVCQAVQHAHQKGVIHRDIKPSNVLIMSQDGTPLVKVIDFGIAKAIGQPLTDKTIYTQFTQLVGTPLYMSPEQAGQSSLDVDTRSDIYSLGVLLYELLTGTTPFGVERLKVVGFDEMRRIIREEEPPKPSTRISTLGQAATTISTNRKTVPKQLSRLLRGELDWIVMKALDKDRNRRYESASAFAADVQRYLKDEPVQACPPSAWYLCRKFVRRHRLGVATALAIVFLASTGAVGTWMYLAERDRLAAAQQRAAAERWMREEVIPSIRRLVSEQNYSAAFELANQAEQRVPDDPTLAELLPQFTSTWTVTTEPAGADLYAKPYDRPHADWRYLGRSPREVRLPREFFRWRVTKEGFTPLEGFRDPVGGRIHYVLDEEGSLPPGMVRVAGNAYRESFYDLSDLRAIDLEDYLIDSCEVTNRQFKEFVDQGGYRERKYWKEQEPFSERNERDGKKRVLSWEEAIMRFTDQTGQPGPATWHSRTYPTGEADYPVRGVSWYEAAAYAKFAGKSLPTVAHWIRASGHEHWASIHPLSNFGRSGPAPVGTYAGLGPFGTSDMAGNVREWCFNEMFFPGSHVHFILGGAWDEHPLLFRLSDNASGFDRSPENGFRCVRYLSDKIPPAAFKCVTLEPAHDFEKETPVLDDVFQAYKNQFAYDRPPLLPLHAHIESEVRSADSIHQTITFDAAYGKERVKAHLYLPRQGTPPYQVVAYHPGGHFWSQTDFPQENPPSEVAFLVRSGRAVLWPVYKGCADRWVHVSGVMADRDLANQVYKDLGRSVDYLHERRDIDREKLAYYGESRGAGMGTIYLAVDERFKVGVLVTGGLARAALPELDPFNYVSRVRVPVLMLVGHNDTMVPLKSAQEPMLKLLGTPEEDKKLVPYDVPGHNVPRDEAEKETLAWLDKYFGKVR